MRWTHCVTLAWLSWWALAVKPQPVFVPQLLQPTNSSHVTASILQGATTFSSLNNDLIIGNDNNDNNNNGSSISRGTIRYKIGNTGKALEFRRIGHQLPYSIVHSLFNEARQDIGQQILDHSPWDRVPGEQWDVIHENVILFIRQNSHLPRRYPKLTWEVVDAMVRGLQDFFTEEEGGRFYHVEFDLLVEFNAHGLVDIAFGGLSYLEPPSS